MPEVWDGNELDNNQSNEESGDHGFLSLIAYSHTADGGQGGYTGYIDVKSD